MTALRKFSLAFLLAAASVAAWADVGRQEAAQIAQQAVPGRVLAVEQVRSGGRPAWRVKIITASGDIRLVLVDAASGRTN